MIFFHVTEENNLPSIIKNGLLPKIGEASRLFGETKERIYCFSKKRRY